MKAPRRLFPLLFLGVPLLGALALGAAVAAVETPALGGAPLAPWQARLAEGADPAVVAGELPVAALADLQGQNALRLGLKAQDRAPVAEAFFSALAQRDPTDAVLLNLSLSYVDQMTGKSLLRQGDLSSRSQRAVARILARDADRWVAWYIRGINNLYWPDWFRKAPLAQESLARAVAIGEGRPPLEQGQNDMYALGYLALGDAYALLDRPVEARDAWSRGQLAYPYVGVLGERLAIPDGDLHRAVRAVRDADRPIDTDLAFLWSQRTPPFAVVLTGGTLYGPGPLEDQQFRPGLLANLYLGGALSGFIPAFNNGAAEPNLPGEIRQGKTVDGLLSDGAPANEHVDVGSVTLMNGKFNLFLAAVQDGPNQGRIHFFLDEGWNWTIRDDVGIDPGFPIGVIKIQEFTFSTSPRVIRFSRQTESGAPAGVDRAGSIASGEVVDGAVGDANFDGRLDGVFNGIGRFPFDSVILPGAPFAQTRVFDTDIPVTPAQAALLTLANALGHLRLALDVQGERPALAAALRQTFAERMELVRRHTQRASLPAPAPATIDRLQAAAGEAELCAGWELLNTQAPANGLRRLDFNASAIKMVCVK